MSGFALPLCVGMEFSWLCRLDPGLVEERGRGNKSHVCVSLFLPPFWEAVWILQDTWWEMHVLNPWVKGTLQAFSHSALLQIPHCATSAGAADNPLMTALES